MLSHKKKLDEHHDKSLQVTEFQCLNSNVQRTCKLSFLCLQEEEEETENQWLFLDSSETWDYKETCYPEICRDKQIQRVTDEIDHLSSLATCEVEVWRGCSLWLHSNTYPKLWGFWVVSKFKLLKNNKDFLKVSTPFSLPLRHFSLPTHTRSPFLFKAWGWV